MGTRVDFYASRGTEAEWLGSYPFDGYPDGVFDEAPELFGEPLMEEEWRAWVDQWLTKNADRATRPEQGWPWPWETSHTTDYAYALHEGVIYGSNFGHPWFRVDPKLKDYGQPDEENETGERAEFPDMSARKATTYGPRSGIIIVGG